MALENVLVLGWLVGANVKLRMGCPTHKVEADVRSTPEGRIELVCGEGQCVLARWDDEARKNRDIREFAERVRDAHLELSEISTSKLA